MKGAEDLDDRKVFRRFPPVPTFVLNIGKINLTRQTSHVIILYS